jgi:hypothetical protein
MKKHILGILLFSLIVGSAGFIYGYFGLIYKSVIKSENCRFRINESDTGGSGSSGYRPILRQVVLDLKTKQINWEFSDKNLKTSIALHFYTVDSNGSKYLKTEYVRSTNDFTSSYLWLDNLKSYENLYVIAVEYPNTHRSMASIPAFDLRKATSVLLYSGKQDYLGEKYLKK